METPKEQMLRTYAWSYFAYHADQRMKTFNFFLIVAGLTASGITSLMRDAHDPRWVCPLGVMLSILSFIFWKIDHRNRQLVRNGEAALKYLDSLHAHPKQENEPHVLAIFERDDFHTKDARATPLLSGHLSYSKCLTVIFWLFILLGLFFTIGALCMPPAPASAKP